MRGGAASSQLSEGGAYAPGTARPRSVNVGRSECPEAQDEVAEKSERKKNKNKNKKREIVRWRRSSVSRPRCKGG